MFIGTTAIIAKNYDIQLFDDMMVYCFSQETCAIAQKTTQQQKLNWNDTYYYIKDVLPLHQP